MVASLYCLIVLSLALVAAAVLNFADPAGDAHGDGGYILPLRPPVSAEALDLRSFSVEREGQTTRLTVGYGGQQNPWDLPSGFSAGVTDVYVRTDAGGRRTLPGLRLEALGGGWQYHLQVSGADALLERYTGEKREVLPRPKVRMDGPNLIIETPSLPEGEHAYWVTSSVYTPLSAEGRLAPSNSASASGLQSGSENAPVPVDVLATPGDRRAYTEGRLAAVGQTRDWRLLTLMGLGALGLILTGLATWRAWYLPEEGQVRR